MISATPTPSLVLVFFSLLFLHRTFFIYKHHLCGSPHPFFQASPANPKQYHKAINMAEASDSSKIIDATPAQVIETAKKVMIDPQPQTFEKELANTVGATVGRKKPKSKRPKSKRGHGKPTGFEEYYAEGPITAAKYEELRKVYGP